MGQNLFNIVSAMEYQGLTMAVTAQGSSVVVQALEPDMSAQLWEARLQIGAPPGGIAFVNPSTGLAIAYSANNEALTLLPYGDNGLTVTFWALLTNEDGTWRTLYVNESEGQIWDIHGGNPKPGTPLYTWNNNGGDNQHWLFQPVGSASK